MNAVDAVDDQWAAAQVLPQPPLGNPISSTTIDSPGITGNPVPTLEDAFTAQWSNGVVRVRWNQGVTVTDDDAAALVQTVDALCPGVCPPMVVELNAMVSLSRCALHIFATELSPKAMAIFGPSAVDATIAAFFIQVHKPTYPTAYFITDAEALDWLTTYEAPVDPNKQHTGHMQKNALARY